jgi:putative SOS response-associated peptidase YedK
MCGRYLLDTLPEALAEQFRSHKAPVFEVRFNIAPTQPILAARLHDGEMTWSQPRWGLVPSWAKDRSGAAKMINARSETVAEKPSFRRAFRERRCLIPASGFYEWQRTATGKQPMLISLRSSPLFAFAGLYEFWRDPLTEQWLETATILTTAANDAVAPIHDRMPVIIAPDHYSQWLGAQAADAALLMKPWPATDVQAWSVSTRVNAVRNDDRALTEPLGLSKPN